MWTTVLRTKTCVVKIEKREGTAKAPWILKCCAVTLIQDDDDGVSRITLMWHAQKQALTNIFKIPVLNAHGVYIWSSSNSNEWYF